MLSSLQNLFGISPSSRSRTQSTGGNDPRGSPRTNTTPAPSPPVDADDLDDGVEYAGGEIRGSRRRLVGRGQSMTPSGIVRGSSTYQDDGIIEDHGPSIGDDDEESWYVPDRITSRNTEGLTVDETTARLFIAGWSFDDAHSLAVLIHKQRYAHRRLRALMQEIAFRIPNLSSGFLSSPVSLNHTVKSLSASSSATAAAATSTVTERQRKLDTTDRQDSSASVGSVASPSSEAGSTALSTSSESKTRSVSDSEGDEVKDTVSQLMPDTAFAVWFPSIAVTAYSPGIDKPSLHPSATGFMGLTLDTASTAASTPISPAISTPHGGQSPAPVGVGSYAATIGLHQPAATGLLTAASATYAATRDEVSEALALAGGSDASPLVAAKSAGSTPPSRNVQLTDLARHYSWESIAQHVPRRDLRRINTLTLQALQDKDDLDEMGAEVLSLIPSTTKFNAGAVTDPEVTTSRRKHHLHRSHLVQDGQAARVRVDIFKAMRHGARFVRVGYNDFTPQTIRLSQDMRMIYWHVPESQSSSTCQRKLAQPLPDPSPDGSRALPLPLSPLLPSDSMEDTRDLCDSSDPRVRRIYYSFYRTTENARVRRRSPTQGLHASLHGVTHQDAALPHDRARSNSTDSEDATDTSSPSHALSLDVLPQGRGPRSMLDPQIMAEDDDRKYKNCRRIPIESITGISTFVTHDRRFVNVRGKMPLTYGLIIHYEFPESVDDYAEEQKVQQHLLNTQPQLREYVTKAAETAAAAIQRASHDSGTGNDSDTDDALGLMSPSLQPVYEGSTLEFSHLAPTEIPGSGLSMDDQVAAPIGSRPIQLKIIRKSIALIALDGNEYHVWLKGLAILRSYFNVAPPEVIASFSSKVVWATIERRWPSNLYLTDIQMGVSMDRAFDAMDVLETAESSHGPRTLPPAPLRPAAPSSRIEVIPVAGATERQPSMLLTRPQLELLLGQVCKKATLLTWKRVFLLTNDGADLSLLMKRVANATYTFIIVRDSNYRVFGGFGTTKWVPGRGYFGNNESFVFRYVNPDPSSLRHTSESTLELYPWAGQISYFQVTDDQGLGFGGGGGTAFHIDRMLRSGKSEWSGTYQNPMLAGTTTFTIYEVEAWIGYAA